MSREYDEAESMSESDETLEGEGDAGERGIGERRSGSYEGLVPSMA